MVDWKKDLKLSDLLGRKGEDEAKPSEQETFRPESHEEGLPEEPFAVEHTDLEGAHQKTQPFWKRELSFGRGREDDATDPDFDDLEPEDEQMPFWKRDLSFGRRRNDVVPETPVSDDLPDGSDALAPAAPESEEAARTPFWKRDFSFGRRDDEPAPDHEPDEFDETPAKRSFFSLRRDKDADFDVPQTEKRQYFKREFSFRRAKDPGVDAGRTEQDKQPFWKRDFSFGRGKHQQDAVAAAPPRSGRKKQLVGLKVGASQVAAAQIVNNGSPQLVQLARQPIEQGIVVGGELRDPDALAEALRDFFNRHKLPNRNVRLGIGNNRIGVRSFEITGIHDPKQLENAIRFRAQEALPIPLDEAVLDYHVIDESVSPTGVRTYRVLLVVAYRELVDRYVAACRGAGLRLVGIDLEAFALLRALSPPPSQGFPEDTALVAVSIGHDRSTFAVSSGTVCEFTRVLDWGGSSLNTAIARALEVPPSQAEPVKRTLSLGDPEEPAASVEDHVAKAQEAVRLELQSFARELVSSLHFYQNQPGSLAIGTIVLTGGTAHMPGLAAELQRLIGVKVRVGDPLRRVKAKGVESPEQIGSMAVAIGLGIED